MNVLFIPAACLGVLGLAFVALFFRLTSRRRINRYAAGLEEIFSPGRYRAMERLLDEADQNFLRIQPACNANAANNFRKTRIVIFRSYMRQLDDDFNLICKGIKLHMITSDADRSELAGIMMKQQLRFAVGMMYVECKLTLYSLGWNGVDAGGLVHSLDAMRAQLQALSALAAPAAA
jgi:hypothetical protein